MAHSLEFVVQQRVDLPCVPFQDLRPRQLGEPIGAALGRRRIGQRHKGVIDLFESNAFLLQLPRHVIVAVGIHLTGERRPGLQANVHQPQFAIDEVVVQDALRHIPPNETWPILAAAELERRTTLHHAQDANQPFEDRRHVQLLFGPGILVDVAGTILPDPAIFLSEELGMPDDFLRPPRRNLVHEVATAHFQAIIDEVLEFISPTDGQMPLEDNSVKTGQNPGDEAGKFDDERAYYCHGIPFLNDC